MPRCKKCDYYNSCDCQFKEGYCKTCYYKKKEDTKKSCNQSLEYLNEIKQRISNQPQSKVNSYRLSIINTQIYNFDKNPCQYYEIIKNFN